MVDFGNGRQLNCFYLRKPSRSSPNISSQSIRRPPARHQNPASRRQPSSKQTTQEATRCHSTSPTSSAMPAREAPIIAPIFQAPTPPLLSNAKLKVSFHDPIGTLTWVCLRIQCTAPLDQLILTGQAGLSRASVERFDDIISKI